MVTSNIQVASINSQLRAFKINVTDKVQLYHSDQLYCHEISYLKQQGLHTHLLEKDNWVSPTIY